ncbi:hypothetical protein WICPIJ_009461 [Wickerhamomyces pijperi]|uniref:Uncharacterized protein n=1 Tax=Wickerhamomyces pijperi TaxID=599730 RepID=A0A9P8PM34_WICPI|nr:hypothetical protein WICPIJ_009461 [Wickerhamomyces pijperi]
MIRLDKIRKQVHQLIIDLSSIRMDLVHTVIVLQLLLYLLLLELEFQLGLVLKVTHLVHILEFPTLDTLIIVHNWKSSIINHRIERLIK